MTKTLTELKICGITKIDQALQIASLGVHAIGVIGVKSSPRFVPAPHRSNLFKKIKDFNPKISRVLVVADIKDSDIKEIITSEGSPSIIQLHGNESPDRCRDLKGKYPELKFWKAFRIRSKLDLQNVSAYENIVDSILLDAWSENKLGGTGNRLNIEWLKDKKFKSTWWLAGGINSDCITEILNKLSPFGLDASSKLEISPGIKNIEKVKQLIKAIRQSHVDIF